MFHRIMKAKPEPIETDPEILILCFHDFVKHDFACPLILSFQTECFHRAKASTTSRLPLAMLPRL